VSADSGWSDMVPVLNSRQRNTLRIRIETLKATKRLQQSKHRPDVRDLFSAASIVDIPLDPPPDYEGLDTNATDVRSYSSTRLDSDLLFGFLS
jgi:hypothetical protein